MLSLHLTKMIWLHVSTLLIATRAGDVTWPLKIPTSGASDVKYFEIAGEHFLAIAQIKDASGDFSTNSKIYRWEHGQFVEYHPVPTSGAAAINAFAIGTDNFLAVSNTYDGAANSWAADSKLYKWDSCFLNEYEKFPTTGATDMKYFNIGSDNYMAVANSQDAASMKVKSGIYQQQQGQFFKAAPIPTKSGYDFEFFSIGYESFLAVANSLERKLLDDGKMAITNRNLSKIYKFTGFEFDELQIIPSTHTVDIEAFSIGSDSFLAAANYYGYDAANTVTHNLHSQIFKYDGAKFEEFQLIQTSGASDMEFFKIGSDSYLAVANAFNDASSAIDSALYKWVGGKWKAFQTIRTNGARDFEYFTIGADSYLGVANWPDYKDGSTSDTNSKILKWDGSNFVDFQEIPTSGAIDLESFTIDGSTFLAVANHEKGDKDTTDPLIYSIVYKWDGAKMMEFQKIPTTGATDFKFFTTNNNNFLVVANAYDGKKSTVDSILFKWNGTTFLEFQTMPTKSAADVEFFVHAHETFLAIANSEEIVPGKTHETNIDSDLYVWSRGEFKSFQAIPGHGTTDMEYFKVGADGFLAIGNSFYAQVIKWAGTQFEKFQEFETLRIADLEAFSIGADAFLAIANHMNGSIPQETEKYKVKSVVYKWNGTAFDHFQDIDTLGADGVKFFTVGSHNILAVANAFDGTSNKVDSVLLKWDGTKFVQFQTLATDGARAFEYFEIGSNSYLAVANWPEATAANSTVYMWDGSQFADVDHTVTGEKTILRTNICTTTTTTTTTLVSVPDGDPIKPEVETTTTVAEVIETTKESISVTEVNGTPKIAGVVGSTTYFLLGLLAFAASS